MSINSLTEDEIRRNITGGGGGAGVVPPPVGPGPVAPVPPVAAPVVPPRTTVNNALSMLVKYIPTESVTLYVAAISAAAALNSFWSITGTHIYWFFAALTPVIFILIYLGKRRALRLPTLPRVSEFPLWKLFACTVAFLVWALAVPGNPYVSPESGGAVVGFFALFISTVLSLLEPIFDRA